MDQQTNLRVLRPSRRKLRPGDVFVMQVPDERYVFGRVIRTDARIGPMTDVILIYIYSPPTRSKDRPERAALSRDRLLVPPVLTNRLPWSRGYFETVDHLPLEDGDVLEQHCFVDALRGRYFDEYNRELEGPVEPVGVWALDSYRTIDDGVSDALGFERAPD